MIFLIFIGWIYYSNDSIITTFIEYVNIIKHEIALLIENEQFKKQMEEQKKFYDKKKSELKRDTDLRINQMISKKKDEITKIKEKYNKILLYLDTIKDQDKLIEILNKLNE